MRYRNFLFLFSGILLSSCATIQLGQKFDLQKFTARVVRNSTSQQDIRKWLGTPTATGVSVEASGEQLILWTYYYGKGKLPALDKAEISILQIKFDHKHRVRAFTWTDTLPPS